MELSLMRCEKTEKSTVKNREIEPFFVILPQSQKIM